MLIYGLKNCDKCRAARKVLPNANFIDIRDYPFSRIEVASLIDNYGQDIINKKSTTWRSLSEIDKQLPTADLLEAYPTLFKRPIIKYRNDNYYFGWTSDIIKKLQSLEN